MSEDDRPFAAAGSMLSEDMVCGRMGSPPSTPPGVDPSPVITVYDLTLDLCLHHEHLDVHSSLV